MNQLIIIKYKIIYKKLFRKKNVVQETPITTE